MSFNHIVELTVDAENDITEFFDVEFDYIPPVAGEYLAAPENCYPSEPDEIEITKITIEGLPDVECTDDLNLDEVEELLWQGKNKWLV